MYGAGTSSSLATAGAVYRPQLPRASGRSAPGACARFRRASLRALAFGQGAFHRVGAGVEISAMAVFAPAPLFTHAYGVLEAARAYNRRFGAVTAQARGAMRALPAQLPRELGFLVFASF